MKGLVNLILRLSIRCLRHLNLTVQRWERKTQVPFNLKLHNFLVTRKAHSYDMGMEKNEEYYSEHYAALITRDLIDSGLSNVDFLVDLGCGQGRMMKMISDSEEIVVKKMLGVDFSKKIIEQAEKTLKDTKQDYSFTVEDILSFLNTVDDNSIDVIFLLEVIYMHPEADKIIGLLPKKLKNSGLVFLSTRSRIYCVQSLLKSGLYASVKTVLENNSGDIYRTGAVLNWTNSREFCKRIKKLGGLDIVSINGIGVCSGIPDDPLEFICEPKQLSDAERKILQDSERSLGKAHPDFGRYILFAIKKEVTDSL